MRISTLRHVQRGFALALCYAAGCATGNDPCEPNPCKSPPDDRCEGTVAFIYPASGACDSVGTLVECTYTPAEIDCTTNGQYCLNGTCLSDPCSPNPCGSPPAASCEGDVAITYAQTGSCEVSDDLVECSYPEQARLNCALTAEACREGECVLSTDPCAPNPCTIPPADFCAGEVATIHPGIGACTVAGEDAVCSYTPVEVSCSESDLVCQEGACMAPPDPCSPNPCTDPPADTCTLDVANVHPSTGACVNNDGSPVCTYTPAQVDCAQSSLVCQDGLCVTPGDPCNPNPCTNPPADTCSANLALQYPATGTCAESSGSATCTYPATNQDCAATGLVCLGGVCTTAPVGGVFISEYVEGTSYNKYLEIFNGTSSSVNLDGYRIRIYSNGATQPSSVLILPAYALLPGAVYVVGDARGTLYTPNLTSANINHNGNDAVELVDAALARLDLIGTIGDSADYAKDVTLVRKAGILEGSSTWAASDWNQLATDTHQLGSHAP